MPDSLCARCARARKTCCQVSEIYVTTEDVRRISTHTGQQDFSTYRVPQDASYAEQDDDPLWQEKVFRSDGSRRVLRRQPSGDCTFLGEHGCSLPLEVRPLVCRLYPFSYTEQGIAPELSEGCPTQLLGPGQGLLQALDMTRNEAIRWHAQLYRELRRETTDHP